MMSRKRFLRAQDWIYKKNAGAKKDNVRLIEDFKASAANAIAETDDTYMTGNLEVFVGISSYFDVSATGRKLNKMRDVRLRTRV